MTTQSEPISITSVYDLERANAAAGQYWFSPDTKRYFQSRIMSDVFPGSRYGVAGCYFVSSEKFRGFRCPDGDRLYSVRWMAAEDGEFPDRHGLATRPVTTGHVYNASEFQAYRSRAGAMRAAERFAKTGGEEIPASIQ